MNSLERVEHPFRLRGRPLPSKVEACKVVILSLGWVEVVASVAVGEPRSTAWAVVPCWGRLGLRQLWSWAWVWFAQAWFDHKRCTSHFQCRRLSSDGEGATCPARGLHHLHKLLLGAGNPQDQPSSRLSYESARIVKVEGRLRGLGLRVSPRLPPAWRSGRRGGPSWWGA